MSERTELEQLEAHLEETRLTFLQKPKATTSCP